MRWIDKVLELALERMPEPLPESEPAPVAPVAGGDAATPGLVTH